MASQAQPSPEVEEEQPTARRLRAIEVLLESILRQLQQNAAAYYSAERLPPDCSERAWRRALKEAPSARLSGRPVIFVDDWNEYVRSLVQRPQRRVRSLTPTSLEAKLASVGARPTRVVKQ